LYLKITNSYRIMSGFFGCISKKDCVLDLFYGTDYHSHLGTRRAGMTVLNSDGFKRAIHNIENDHFRTKFEPELENLHGRSGIGIISDFESSPIIASSHLGRFAISMVGKISNLEALEERALKMGQRFAELSEKGVNQTELASILICEGQTFEEGINNLFKLIRGSCSLLMLTENGIYAARDKLGRTPVVIGEKEDGYAVATESISFPNLGFEITRSLGPGEVVLITEEGIEVKQPAGDRMQICGFLWVYYGYPAAIYEKVNVDACRYRCGASLARRDHVEADCVSGIPDSGVGHAIGYSNERGIPYTRPFVKYSPTWPRSFMPQNQEVRDHIARMKLIVNRELIADKRIIFCEDSIVRGTQLKDNTQKLFEEGAREVHLRIACPTLLFPCEFLNFSISRTRLDLAGRRAIYELLGTDEVDLEKYMDEDAEEYRSMVEQIRKRLKLTSLMYQRMDDLVKAIGLPKEKLCTHCWDGSSYS
jgi:amidophosphoribosyltransferase